MSNSIEVINLSKTYKSKKAVRNINFKINENEIMGLLGPNGCGKTTTIGMILGLLKPTSGKVFINGLDIENYAELIQFVDDRPGHDARYAINSTKIQNELGWKPKETFESGIKKTVDWYLKNLDWCNRVQNGSYMRERLGLDF